MKWIDIKTGDVEGVTNGRHPQHGPTQTIPVDLEAILEAGCTVQDVLDGLDRYGLSKKVTIRVSQKDVDEAREAVKKALTDGN